jgi:hypothetical protein
MSGADRKVVIQGLVVVAVLLTIGLIVVSFLSYEHAGAGVEEAGAATLGAALLAVIAILGSYLRKE